MRFHSASLMVLTSMPRTSTPICAPNSRISSIAFLPARGQRANHLVMRSQYPEARIDNSRLRTPPPRRRRASDLSGGTTAVLVDAGADDLRLGAERVQELPEDPLRQRDADRAIAPWPDVLIARHVEGAENPGPAGARRSSYRSPCRRSNDAHGGSAA